LLILSRSIYKHGHHRQFFFLIGRFLKIFSLPRMLPTKFWFIWPSGVRGEQFFRNQQIRNKNGLWLPCLLTDRDEFSNLYRGPSIDASYQVSVHLAKRFQRVRRLSSINFSHFNLLLWNRSAKWSETYLVGSIYGRSSLKIAHFVPIHLQTWPPIYSLRIISFFK
jgi:hypothetical protein